MEMDNNTGNGKTMLVPVIAISLFMMLVFGATFAYFTASVTIDNVANVKAVIPQKGTALVTTSNSCVISVDASNMTKNKAGSSGLLVGQSDCYLQVEYTALENVLCTYDVKLLETSGTAYAPSTGVSSTRKEFTASIAATGPGASSSVTSETQINTIKGTVVASATATGTGSKITQTYTLTEKFYNLADITTNDGKGNQDSHAGKTYTFNLVVDNVQC